MKNFLVYIRFHITVFSFLLIVGTLNLHGQVNGPIKYDTLYLQVDMGLMVTSGVFQPSTDTVEVEGTMNTDTVKMMIRQGDGYVYQLTYVLPVNGYYTYKFRINSTDTIYTESADPSTRAFRIKDTTQTIFNYYNNYNPAVIPMVFDCDMYYQIKSGNFSPAIDYLDVTGNFNNWGNDRIELFPRSTDSIYSFTIYYDTAAIPTIPFEFKFRFNGDSATTELQGDTNRVFTMTAANHNFFCWYDNIDPNVPSLPFVYNVAIHDSIISKHTVTGAYNYGDYNLRPEGKSIYQWYTANSSGGALTAIDSAWYINYTIDSLLIGKYLIFEVKPITIDSVVGLPVQVWSPTKIVGVGLNEIEYPLAKIFPNPVNDIINIELREPMKSLELINILGRRIVSEDIKGMDRMQINLNDADPGVYFLKLTGFNNSVRFFTIIKQ
jgi:hypothetical protein